MRKTVNKIYLFTLLIARPLLFVLAFFVFLRKFSSFYNFYHLVQLSEIYGVKYKIVFIANIAFLAISIIAFFYNLVNQRKNNLIFNIIIALLSLLLAGYSVYSFPIENISYLIIVLIYLVNLVFSTAITLLVPFINTEYGESTFRTLCKSCIARGIQNLDIKEAFYPDVRSDLNIFNFQRISLKYAQHFDYPKVRTTLLNEFEKLCNSSIYSVSYDEILQNYDFSEDYIISLIRKRNKQDFATVDKKVSEFNSSIKKYNEVFAGFYKQFIIKADEYLKHERILEKFKNEIKNIETYENERVGALYKNAADKIETYQKELDSFLQKFNDATPNLKLSIEEMESSFKNILKVIDLVICETNADEIDKILIELKIINEKHLQISECLESKIKPFSLDYENVIYDYYEFKFNDTTKIDSLLDLLAKNRVTYKEKIKKHNSQCTIADAILNNVYLSIDMITQIVAADLQVNEYICVFEELLGYYNQSKTDSLYLAIGYLKNNRVNDANDCLNKSNISRFVDYRDKDGNNFLHFYPVGEDARIKSILGTYPELIPLLYEHNNLGIVPYDNPNFYNYFDEKWNKFELTYENVFKGVPYLTKIRMFRKYISKLLENFAMDSKVETKYRTDLATLSSGSTTSANNVCKKYFENYLTKIKLTRYDRIMKHSKAYVVKFDEQDVFDYSRKILQELNDDKTIEMIQNLETLNKLTFSRLTAGFSPYTNKNLYSGLPNTYLPSLVAKNFFEIKNKESDLFGLKKQATELFEKVLNLSKKYYSMNQVQEAFENIVFVDPSFGEKNNKNDALCKLLGLPLGSSNKQIKTAILRKKKQLLVTNTVASRKELAQLDDLQKKINKLS